MVRRRRVARTEGGGRDPRASPRNTWSPVSSCHFSAMLSRRSSGLGALTAVLLAAMDEDDLDLRLRVGSAREENLSISIDNRAPPSCEGIKSRIGIGSNQSKGRCGTTWDGYRRCCHDWRARVPRVVCGSGGPATFSPRSQGLPRSLQIPSTSARTITQANPYPLQLKKKGASFSPRRRRRGKGGRGGGVLARRARGVGF